MPFALECGMPLDIFWNDDPSYLNIYYKAYINRIHKEKHIEGAYINVAFSVALSNAFKKKHSQATPYPQEAIFNPNLKQSKSKEEKDDNGILFANYEENKNTLYSAKQIFTERLKR